MKNTFSSATEIRNIRSTNGSRHRVAKSQSGVVLIEALLGILIFSIGILAIVGLQSFAVRTTGDTALRIVATGYANQYISDMRALTPGYDPTTDYSTGGTAFNTWFTKVSADMPGASAVVAVTPFYGSAAASAASTPYAYSVDITLNWVQPGKTLNGGNSTYRMSTSIEP